MNNTVKESKECKETKALINRLVSSGKKSLKSYRENFQTAFEVFVANYNTKLTYNSTPLLTIVKGLSYNDKQLMLDYIKKATNIKTCKIIKDKITLVFENVTDEKNPLQYDNDFIDNHKWFEQLEKKEKEPLTITSDKLITRLKAVFTLARNSNLTDEQIKKAVNTALKA